MEIAIEEKDHATRIFLQWFVTEQVEEEENDHEIIDQLKLIGGNSQGLMMLDKDLAPAYRHCSVGFQLECPCGFRRIGPFTVRLVRWFVGGRHKGVLRYIGT